MKKGPIGPEKKLRPRAISVPGLFRVLFAPVVAPFTAARMGPYKGQHRHGRGFIGRRVLEQGKWSADAANQSVGRGTFDCDAWARKSGSLDQFQNRAEKLPVITDLVLSSQANYRKAVE
ncbi:MAG: hypothetical protein ACE5EM_04555 [Sphingomonadales bacterium]